MIARSFLGECAWGGEPLLNQRSEALGHDPGLTLGAKYDVTKHVRMGQIGVS
jgi:hypothetical protein